MTNAIALGCTEIMQSKEGRYLISVSASSFEHMLILDRLLDYSVRNLHKLQTSEIITSSIFIASIPTFLYNNTHVLS